MDEFGRGSIGPAMETRGRKDKHSYIGPQAEVEDDAYHGACQRRTGYEEDACRTLSRIEIEEGAPRSNGISPRKGSKGHCAGGRRKEYHGTNSCRVHRDDQ
jgi:hypothetical protein